MGDRNVTKNITGLVMMANDTVSPVEEYWTYVTQHLRISIELRICVREMIRNR